MSRAALPSSGEVSGRLLRAGRDAAWNMAVDEALLDGAQRDPRPLLRFYSWEMPAVTLGRFQTLSQTIDERRCRSLGIAVVRRATGGRAVFHETDLTYSIVLPQDALEGNSIRGSYRVLGAAMAEALRRLGLDAGEGSESASASGGRADCFAHLTLSDVAAEGRKVIGSAQLRRGGWILQQGSIRLWPIKVPSGLFVDGDPDPTPTSSDGSSSGTLPSIERVVDVMVDTLGSALNCTLIEDRLTPAEEVRTRCLVDRKYATNRWNQDEVDPREEDR